MSTGRKGRGRQKIEMKKMSNESNMQVTFSKRRGGLFKKASELSTLCGADMALVVFSPGEKVFSFGHPHVDTIIDRYLSRVPPQINGTMQFLEAQRSANVRELNNHLTEINSMLDIEKKCGDELSNLRKAAEAQFWWACPIDGMNRAQVVLFKKALEELKKLVTQHVDRLDLGIRLPLTSYEKEILDHFMFPLHNSSLVPGVSSGYSNTIARIACGGSGPPNIFLNVPKVTRSLSKVDKDMKAIMLSFSGDLILHNKVAKVGFVEGRKDMFASTMLNPMVTPFALALFKDWSKKKRVGTDVATPNKDQVKSTKLVKVDFVVNSAEGDYAFVFQNFPFSQRDLVKEIAACVKSVVPLLNKLAIDPEEFLVPFRLPQ
ncbi:hypothetical protein KIW84_065728 [Lathyrus oleraceus]|uniref:MADS-box domain-containing protein n=1 Tax=Pisum sativum TaxID=3888 RepID=A0A9D5ACW2_PEA|nr:hypothetical protein KIW84_065728 [Pisum sativum]